MFPFFLDGWGIYVKLVIMMVLFYYIKYETDLF